MIRSERNADGEDRRLHAVFLQNRIGQRVIAPVSVVKGNDDRLLGKRLAAQDIRLQLVERDAGIPGLGKRPDLRLKLLRGHHFAVRHVLGQMVVHEDGHLRVDLIGRKRRRGQDVQEIILRGVGGHIGSEIVRDPEICAACHAGADHLADVVAEVRAVVEIAHLAADAAGRKIPERRDLCQRAVKLRDGFRFIIFQILSIYRPGRDGEVHTRFLAQGLDRRDALHTLLRVRKRERLVRIVGEDGVAFEITLLAADRLCVAHTLVIAACPLVKHVERLRQNGVRAQRVQLGQRIARVGEEIARVIGQHGRVRVLLIVEVLRQPVGFLVVGQAVVEIDVQNEGFDLVMLHQILRDLFAVAHIRAVHDEIVKAGAIRLVERVYRERAGGRAAENIGIVFVVVLLEISELCHARVIRLVVGEPGKQPVPERAEGVDGKIQPRQQRGQHKDGHEKDQHPFF